MWWFFRKSKKVGKVGRVTVSKGGVSGSVGTKRVRLTASKRGGRVSAKVFGIRLGGKLW
jgi:hypothetical protein